MLDIILHEISSTKLKGYKIAKIGFSDVSDFFEGILIPLYSGIPESKKTRWVMFLVSFIVQSLTHTINKSNFFFTIIEINIRIKY